jgi:uncharacterized membrane protein YfcA
MHIDWMLALAGLGVGFVVGLTGMGGGALMTPILVLVFKVPPLQAVSSDLVASMVMKPIGGGVHLKKGTVNLRLVGWLVVGSVPAAFASVWALQQFADPAKVNDVVQWTVGVALLLASLGLAVKGAFSGRRGSADNALASVTLHPVRTVAIGVFGGVMVGLTSVGSGSLMMVLLLVLYPALSAKQLVGTDLVQAIPLVGAAALAHLLFGEVQLDITGALLIGAIPGVYLGAHVSSRAADHIIRPILAMVLIVSGLKMLHVPTAAVGVIALVLAVVAALMIWRSPTTDGVEAAGLATDLEPAPVVD